MIRVFILAVIVTSVGCTKIYDGSPGVGGNIPSNFIAVKDSSFNPGILQIAVGSSVTFVNNTNADKIIIGADSNQIPRRTIAAGKFFTFTPANAGNISYQRADKVSVTGNINVTP